MVLVCCMPSQNKLRSRENGQYGHSNEIKWTVWPYILYFCLMITQKPALYKHPPLLVMLPHASIAHTPSLPIQPLKIKKKKREDGTFQILQILVHWIATGLVQAPLILSSYPPPPRPLIFPPPSLPSQHERSMAPRILLPPAPPPLCWPPPPPLSLTSSQRQLRCHH